LYDEYERVAGKELEVDGDDEIREMRLRNDGK
jgi:hypothetical protein